MEINPTLSTITHFVLRKLRFHVDERGIERIIQSLLMDPSIWDVMWHSKQPIKVVQETITILKNHELVTFDKERVVFSDKGIKWTQKLGISPLSISACTHCEGRGITFDNKSLKEFLAIQKNRPLPIQEYGQAYVTPQTTLARAAHAISYGDIDAKKIIILGAEDDLLGLALALTKRPKKVVVLEVDKRIVDFDNMWAKRLNLPLEARVFDLQQKLPKELISKFDTFFTDPPETISAINNFIFKGAHTLKSPGCSGYFGFTLHDSTLQKWQKLQKTILKNNFVITDIIQDFNEYENFSYIENTPAFTSSPLAFVPEKRWFHSHWYRIVALPGFLGNNEVVNVGKDLYYDKESASY